MAVMQQQTFLTVGEIAVRLRTLEARVRRFLRQPRDYVIRLGTARGVAEADMPRLVADLKAAGVVPADFVDAAAPGGA